jgi:alginate O-acetyltransferase complex protein AlgI
VDAVFGAPDAEVGTAAAWLGVAAYHLQLYFDFSGYSDMAIGLGRMLGFRLPENFDRPLSSVSFTDFWRRWHMTMSTWFRDYLYFPMGGASRSRARNAFNLVTVFLAVGLWHGADWTFVAFGAYHGTVIVIERALRAREDTHRALRRAFTTFLLLMGWPLFRGDSLAHAGALWADLFRFDTAPLPVDLQLALTNRTVLVFALASLVVLLPTKVKAGTFLMSGRGPWVAPARLATMVAMFYAGLLVVSGTYSPFLYFQF